MFLIALFLFFVAVFIFAVISWIVNLIRKDYNQMCIWNLVVCISALFINVINLIGIITN